jgi:antitoxin PrlF
VVREKLGLKPGDHLAYVLTEKGFVIEKAHFGAEDDPFALFTEWASKADDEAYADL